jgi:hypothetical protein
MRIHAHTSFELVAKMISKDLHESVLDRAGNEHPLRRIQEVIVMTALAISALRVANRTESTNNGRRS